MHVQLLLRVLTTFVFVYVPLAPHKKQLPFARMTVLEAAWQGTQDGRIQVLVPLHRHPPFPSPVELTGQAVQFAPDR